jgi:hypothetical protein
MEKPVMRRPRANEGGREEEERRPEIAAGGTGCPHDRKKGDVTAATTHGRPTGTTGLRTDRAGPQDLRGRVCERLRAVMDEY